MPVPGKMALAGLMMPWLMACGGSEPQIKKTPACTEAHEVSFADLPNGPLTETTINGITFQPNGGYTSVERVKEHDVLLLAGGEVAFFPGCQASSIEITYDDSEAEITIDLYSSPFAGKVLLTEKSGSLDATPLQDGYWQATAETPDGKPTVERFEIRGGSTGSDSKDATSTLLREVIVR